MALGSTSDIDARLPWPLAQLYARARAAEPRDSRPGAPPHASAFLLLEAFGKLAAAALVGEYAAAIAAGAPRVASLDSAACALGRPAAEVDPAAAWSAALDAFARAASAAPGESWAAALLAPRTGSPALAALRRQLRSLPAHPSESSPNFSRTGEDDGANSEASSGSLLDLFAHLARHRASALGSAAGGEPGSTAFARDVGPLLLPAIDELLADYERSAAGAAHPLGPAGTRLLYVVDVDAHPADPGRAMAVARPLHGPDASTPTRENVPLRADPGALVRRAVILARPGVDAPVRLDPLVSFDNLRLTPDLLFIDGGGRYRSYATDQVEVVDAAPAGGPVAALLFGSSGTLSVPTQDVLTPDVPAPADRPRWDTTPPTEPIPPRQADGAEGFPSLAALLGGGPVYPATPAATDARPVTASPDASVPGTRLGPAERPAPAVSASGRPATGSASAVPSPASPTSAGGRRHTSVAPRRAVPALKLRAGEMIHGGRFTVLSFQGGGGMGEVYRARDNTTGEDVALKFLPRERTADPVWLDQLKSEVRSAHRVRSPYVCAVHDIHVPHERHEGTSVPPFIAMEFVDGEDLDRQLHRVGGLNVNTVVRIAHELAQGLRAVHRAGLLHRDMKPSNVMLDVNGEVRILDFGIAAPADGEGDTAVAGTLAYMAPEVRRGERPASEASDLYAVGLVLLELLTGGRPESGSRTDVMLRNGTADESVFGRAREQVSPKLRAAILGCLRPNPDERFQTAQAFEDALPAESARSLRRAEAIGAIAGSDALAPLSSRWLVVALAAILLGCVGYFAVQPRSSPTARTKVTADVDDLRDRAAQAAEVLSRPWAEGRPPDTDRDWGFGPNRDLLQGPNAGSPDLPAATFWFRSGPRSLEPFNSVTGVTDIDPPGTPGSTVVRLGPAGEFLAAWRRPTEGEVAKPAAGLPSPPRALDVVSLLTAATGKPLADGPLPVAIGAEPVWKSIWPDGGPVPTWSVLVGTRPYVASTVGTALVYLKRDDPAPPPVVEENADLREALSAVNFWWTGLATLVGLGLARRNVRLGRCNVGTASRLALLVLASGLVGWVLVTHPQVSGRGALARWTAGVGAALFVAGQAGVFCAAVDPYARLTWKRCLIGYARLTTDWPASLRDPLVGRSLLVGLGFGLAMSVMLRASDLLNDGPAAPYTALLREQLYLRGWGSSLRSAGLLAGAVATALRYTLQQLVIIVLMYWVTRSRGAALALFCLANTVLMMVLRSDYSTSAAAAMAVFSVLTATLIVREGILASAVGMFVVMTLLQVPLSFAPGAWNFGFSLAVVAVFATLAGIGLVAALPEGGWGRVAALFRDPIEPASDPRDGASGGGESVG